jgi:formylglycine-generating enzyme required for sulfatase activity
MLTTLLAAAVAAAVAPGSGSAQADSPPSCPEGMRALGGGRFTLADGSDTVEVAPFCLEAVEVTAASYTTCVRAGVCDAEELVCSNAATYGKPGKANHPINCVSWIEADAFCRWRGRRLPSEGEWEWAARGQGKGTHYPWGDAPPARRACWDGKGNTLGSGGRHGTCLVASHLDGDSPDGIHDLAGNVREWTSTGDDRERVLRGGSWGDSLDWFLAAGFRGLNHPTERFELTGFRCAADLPVPADDGPDLPRPR